MTSSKSADERFEQFIERIPLSGCWLFMGESANEFGHGKFHLDGKRYMAHRFSYERFVGPIGDKWVLHRCDVPCCVNPSHLFLGTHGDNMKDMVSKGRSDKRANEKHHMCKLTDKEVADIRRMHAAGGISMTSIAKQFGVSQPAVSMIVNYKRRNLGGKKQ